jgi:hypothetical protein
LGLGAWDLGLGTWDLGLGTSLSNIQMPSMSTEFPKNP